MYHYVRPESEIHGPASVAGHGCLDALALRDFETQVDWLSAKYEPIDWPTLYAWREGRAALPDRSFLLTFDDGLSDHARHVAPVLKHRGVRGVFFVPGVVLAEECMLPAHLIHVLMARLGALRLSDVLCDGLRESGDVAADFFSDTSWHGDAENLYHYETPDRARLKYLLTVRLPASVRNQHLERLFYAHIGSPKRWSREWYLTWDDVVSLHAGGHTVGGHGYTHEPLVGLSESEQAEDIRRVAQLFEDAFGRTRRPFSYPYGRVTDATPAICRGSGFSQAFTTQERWLTEADDPFLWPRVDTIHVDQFIEQESRCRAAQ